MVGATVPAAAGVATDCDSQSMADTVSGYIGRQEEHHRGRSFQDEFTQLLRRHRIGIGFNAEAGVEEKGGHGPSD